MFIKPYFYINLYFFTNGNSINKDIINNNANEIVSVIDDFNVYNISLVDVLEGNS